MAGIFRKKAIDRLLSPEQLDKMIVIVQPSTWLVLLGLVILTISIAVWGVLGTIQETYSSLGIIVKQEQYSNAEVDESLTLVSYVPYTDKNSITKGMEVSITCTVNDQHYTAYVENVDNLTVDFESMTDTLGDEGLTAYFWQDLPLVCVRCRIDDHFAEAKSCLDNGCIVQANYIINKLHPIQFVFMDN